MTIKSKLWLGFGLLICLFVAALAFLNIQLRTIGNQAIYAFETPLTAVDSTRAAWNTFTDSRNLVNRQLAAVNFSDSAAKGRELANFQQTFNQQLSQARSAIETMGLEVDFNQLEQLASQWYQKNTQRIGAAATTALVDERVLTALDSQLGEQLNALVTASLEAAKQQKASTAQQIDSSQQLGFMLMIVALLASLIIAVLLYRSTLKPLSGLMAAVSDLARGDADLTVRLAVKRRDEIGVLSEELNAFIERIHSLLQATRHSTEAAVDTLQHFSTLTSAAHLGAQTQQQQLTAARDEIDQISLGVADVESQAAHAKQQGSVINQQTLQSVELMNNAANNIQALTQDVSNARDNIEKLSADSNNISALIDVIEGIADQTNLLALNAAIEAARAGDAGRGFAVVADEVRALAKKTRDSTEDIQNTVNGIRQQVDSAHDLMEGNRQLAEDCVSQSVSVTQALEGIGSEIAQIEQANGTISASAMTQSESMSHIQQQMLAVDQIANDTQRNAAELETGKAQLIKALKDVEAQIGQFKL